MDKHGLSRMNTLRYDQNVEEHMKYYRNSCYYKNASVNPTLNALIDVVSKINWHDRNSQRGRTIEKLLKIVSLIYSKVESKLSDALSICPKQYQSIAFSALKLGDIYKADMRESLNILNKSIMADSGFNGFSDIITSMMGENTSIDVNFNERNEIINSHSDMYDIVNVKTNELAKNNDGNNFIAPDIIKSRTLPKEADEISDDYKKNLEICIMKEYENWIDTGKLNEIVGFLMSSFLRICYSSLRFLNSQRKRYENKDVESEVYTKNYLSYMENLYAKILREINRLRAEGAAYIPANHVMESDFATEKLNSEYFMSLNAFFFNQLKEKKNIMTVLVKVHKEIKNKMNEYYKKNYNDGLIQKLNELKLEVYEEIQKLNLVSPDNKNSSFGNITYAILAPLLTPISLNEKKKLFDPRLKSFCRTKLLDLKLIKYPFNKKEEKARANKLDGLKYHSFADDSIINIFEKSPSITSISAIEKCVENNQEKMTSSGNEDSSQVFSSLAPPPQIPLYNKIFFPELSETSPLHVLEGSLDITQLTDCTIPQTPQLNLTKFLNNSQEDSTSIDPKLTDQKKIDLNNNESLSCNPEKNEFFLSNTIYQKPSHFENRKKRVKSIFDRLGTGSISDELQTPNSKRPKSVFQRLDLSRDKLDLLNLSTTSKHSCVSISILDDNNRQVYEKDNLESNYVNRYQNMEFSLSSYRVNEVTQMNENMEICSKISDHESPSMVQIQNRILKNDFDNKKSNLADFD